ncbi:MAG: hypothetical protein R3Y63_14750 [Eubacteriales bacterium]
MDKNTFSNHSTGNVGLTILLAPLILIFSLVPITGAIGTGFSAIACATAYIPAVIENTASAISLLGLGLLSVGLCMLCTKITQSTFGLLKLLFQKNSIV